MAPRKRKTGKDLPPRVYLHGRQYRFVPVDPVTGGNGKPIPLGRDKAAALRKWASIIGQADSGTAEGTIAALWERYEREELPRKAAASRVSNEQQIKRLLPVFGAMQAEDLRAQHAIRYLDIRGKQSPTQANREIALLRHMMTKAVHWGWVETNPLMRLQYRQPEKARDRYVTDQEMRVAMRLARPWLRYLIWIGYLTGLRRGDLLKITRFHCKDDGIEIREGKTGKKAIIAWTPALRNVVRRALEAGSDVRLFPVTDSAVNNAWKRLGIAMEKAGYERFQMKDIRAKHATDLEEAGGDATAQLGHSQRAVTAKHYLRKPRIVVPIGRKKT